MKSNNQILNEIMYGTGLTASTNSNAILNALADGSAVLPIKLNNVKTVTGQTTDGKATTIASIVLENNCIYNISVKGIGVGAEDTPTAAASYTGTPPGCTSAITITADYVGLDGNSITLNFDGSKTITQIIEAWNIAYSANTCTLDGVGTQIVNNKEKITLTGGTSSFKPYTAVNVIGSAKVENGSVSTSGVAVNKFVDDYTNCVFTIQNGTGLNLDVIAVGIAATTINWSAKVEWNSIEF
jgi:hypothetical protein